MRRATLAILFAALAQPAFAGFTEGQARYLRNDFAGARAEWAAAAEHGDARALYGLGVLHWRGLGVAPDALEAARCFAAAARQGYRPALTALAALAAEFANDPAAPRRSGWGV